MDKQPVKSEATCKLCGHKEKPCNSHIIPEFLYKDVYDQNPKRFNIISTDPSDPNRWEAGTLRDFLPNWQMNTERRASSNPSLKLATL